MQFLQSRDNPQFKHWLKLTQQAGARRKHQQTLLDGVHLLAAALEAGCCPLAVCYPANIPLNEEIDTLLQRLPRQTRQFTLASALFRELSPVASPTGILACIPWCSPPMPTQPGFALLLEAIQDPGNLGSILRTAAAAGVEAVYCSDACVDVWSPKVLRGGMGAHFRLAIAERCDLSAYALHFDGKVVATSLTGQTDLFALDLRSSVAFILGNEGAGISPALQALASEQVRIPMQTGMESLNVAASAAICCFETLRQRRV